MEHEPHTEAALLEHAAGGLESTLMVLDAREELPDVLAYCEREGLSREAALASSSPVGDDEGGVVEEDEELIPGTYDDEPEGKSELDRSPRANWVEKRGGLPRYIVRIAKHLIAKGMSIAHAIAVAINAAKKMCATGDLNWPGLQNVNPGSRAEACAAVAAWERLKAG